MKSIYKELFTAELNLSSARALLENEIKNNVRLPQCSFNPDVLYVGQHSNLALAKRAHKRDYGISFHRGLNLNAILALLEQGNNYDVSNQTSHVDVIMMPPSNANCEVTDEDSGDEDQVRSSNLFRS
ncbi:hypothetical protein HHI36_005360 [Cryptolaemus montrouzieri]|uniref:Uncharacterized protein n=1 Tax=Cryptolaemus montrouzieri TaxID=559131 RepID=A0ABD2NU35_9CUCU